MHYTPKHGSWLNPAELEASLWSRQCLGRQRVASLAELRERTSAWNRWVNRIKLKIDWRFSTLTLVACSTTNESLPMSRSTSFSTQ